MGRKVVVTGMGVVSSIANNIPSFLENLQKGISGRAPIQAFDPEQYGLCFGYEVKDFRGGDFGVKLLDPFIQYAIAAATEAIESSALNMDEIDSTRIGIAVSSSKGGMHTFDRFRERFEKNKSAILGARIYSSLVPNFAAQWIARRFKIKGPAKCHIAACATGTMALLEGYHLVSEGAVDYCLAGSSDASIVPVLLCGYKNMKALSKSQIKPYDKNRDGFLVGEGAGILTLETEESAKARGATIYGEIVGGAFFQDSKSNIHFDQEESALARSIERTLEKTNIAKEDIDYINSHGTGTISGDIYETEQIKKVFKEKAQNIPLSSIKPAIGHMLGASGAVEAIATLLSIKNNFIPPTLGLDELDERCDLNYTPNKMRRTEVKNALSISMGFGGHTACLAFRGD